MSYSVLLVVLLPLIMGYFLPLPCPYTNLQNLIHHLLNWMVYAIIFFMGVSMAMLGDLGDNLLLIVRDFTVISSTILSINLVALYLLERFHPWHLATQHTPPLSRRQAIFDSLRLCAIVVLGFLLGSTHWSWLHHAHYGCRAALLLMLLIVGIQLSHNGMKLRELALNRTGLLIASITISSSLLGGILAALLLGMPIRIGMALASSYGWYSLSSGLMTEACGSVIGSIAFFNDLIRELFAIILIPTLSRCGLSVALGICGATSMNCTLPALQRSAGLEIVPAAITHGFILSLLAPILMGFFSM